MSTCFSPQRDAYILMRREFPSPMMVGDTVIDRAAYRLAISGHILSDVEFWRLERILALRNTSAKERELVKAELDRRRIHSTFEREEGK